MIRTVVVTCCVVTLVVSSAIADEGGGTRGYAWARNPQGARAVAMGGAYSALVSGPLSSFWNPAGHAVTENASFDAGYRQAFEGVHSGYLAAAWPHGSGSVAASMAYMSFGDLEVVDTNGQPTGGRFTPSAGSLSLGRGWDISSDGLHAGIESRVYYQSIDDVSSTAVGVDMGVAWRGADASAAFVVRNVGAEISSFRETSEALPLAIAMGFAWHPATAPAVVSVELEDPNDGSLLVHGGMESWIGDIVALRAGFDSRYRNQGTEAELFDGLSAGFGVGRGTGAEIGYAVSFQGELGVGHRLSIDRRFD